MITGLARFYGLHAMQQLLKSRAAKVKETYERVFHTIHLLLAFPDLDKQFHGDREDTGPGYHSDYDYTNPKSKVYFLVLWLYSIEPPLYFHFNQACRRRDSKLIPLLGPFANALG